MFGRDRKSNPASADGPDEAANGTAAELTNMQTTTSTKTREEYSTGVRLALVLSSAFVSIFLVSLDRLIVTTAIPAITDQFHSLPDVGWYGSAYLLTSAAFQLLFGKLYGFYPIRAVFGSSVILFEVGSAICGAAPNSIAFILGRAIQGIGSAGIFAGGIVIIVYAVPLEKRPLYQGLFGAVFGVSSILGPLVGGAFTSNVTWRWCFYINIPFGVVAFIVIIVFLRVPDRPETRISTKAKLSQLDALGTAALIPAVVSLLLAVQWGGLTFPWNDRRVIALLTLGIFLFIVFVLVQSFLPKTATIPPHILKQRSIMAGFWATLTAGSQLMIFVYYLPIWFQAIKGVSAVNSGIRLLPTTLALVLASISNGVFISKIGYYTPTMILGSVLVTIGGGLLTTLQVDTGAGKWIGYQILYGLGQGLCFQAPNLAAQTVLAQKDVSVGASLMFFTQILGGAIFISVGQNVLDNQLGFPGFSASIIKNGGATELINSLPADLRPDALVAYNESLRVVFQIGLILAALSVLGAVAMEFRSVKKNKPSLSTDPADVEKGAADNTDNTSSKSQEAHAKDTEADAMSKSSSKDGQVTPAGGSIDHGDSVPHHEEKQKLSADTAV
ncbi:major facilitator superfamily domain-containing protein [Xylariaceae sp. FL1019]|nr:major facilitator superfamily domain-containing protein [Xylariaceae sp. FL1019]